VDPDAVLRAYRAGIFPMADPVTRRVGWYSSDPRGILPLDAFHVPRTVRAALKKFTVTSDRDFEGVVDGCADRRETWISPEIRETYVELHRRGHAHSIEAWKGPKLAGGLYGVHIGAAFFAESMFHRVTDGGKVALVRFAEHLVKLKFALCDIQMVTRITARFGAIQIPREEYMKRLTAAVSRSATWKPL
jgi:leucyl/phenylalanyl-tRNA--protein transferase